MSDIKLPANVTVEDTKYPVWSESAPARVYDKDFELWYSEKFGWVIPTLLIKRAGRKAQAAGIETDRYYGIAVKDGGMVRIGHGPHIKKTVSVYVTEANKDRLLSLITLKFEGANKANEARDIRSTRVMRSKYWSF